MVIILEFAPSLHIDSSIGLQQALPNLMCVHLSWRAWLDFLRTSQISFLPAFFEEDFLGLASPMLEVV